MAAQHLLGAQMFTVRNFCKDNEGVRESMKKLADIGYKTVQVSGFGPVDWKEVAKAAKDNGIQIVTSHSAWPRFKNDLDLLIEEHEWMDCRCLAIGGIGKDYFTMEGITRFLDELAPISEKLAKHNMSFSYHNHNMEFVKYDGKAWLDWLYEKADPKMLCAELDVYWVQAGGGDPVQWIRKCAGREPIVHLKDMVMTMEREQHFAEIGEGNMNFSAILQAAKESGVQYFMVEQDNTYGRDPFESLAISYRNLRAMGME